MGDRVPCLQDGFRKGRTPVWYGEGRPDARPGYTGGLDWQLHEEELENEDEDAKWQQEIPLGCGGKKTGRADHELP